MSCWSTVADPAPIELTDRQRQVLVALVEGYRAREGMKERIRALNDWEIARRSGSTALSYAEYMRDPSRDGLIHVLSELQRLGLVSTWDRGANFDTFVPTPSGNSTVDSQAAEAGPVEQSERAGAQLALDSGDPVIERLDAIIHLLRSIDGKLSAPR